MHLAFAAIALDSTASNGHGETISQSVDNKHILVSQAQNWVTENRQVQKSMVEVAASDRRLIIPACETAFEFNYPFAASQKTLRASCPQSGWQIFLGISVHQSDNALRYTGNFKAGHQLVSADVELVSLSSSIAGLASDLRAIEGFSLASAVRAGDLVMQRQLVTPIEGYRLNRAVGAGEIIESSSIDSILIASATSSRSQTVTLEQLDGARAARDLAPGKILSNYDIKQRHQVLITQSGIPRGQAITRSNIALQDYYGKLPNDSLQNYRSAEQMQAIRNLAAGSLLRLSDLTPIDIIRKGDNVQLSVRAGALEITVTMLALENARLEQRVLLLNTESGEEIQGIATAVGQARGLSTVAR
ncbi:flagellar basal body P-ring formation chaperone FlgA [Porticoccaceae bacterium]|nr:flagellar basal body P-ring formation chaperone FlgA [Porticoccaceae bacterium]MDB4580992.1 flagellar basal body P-ring formation chaperone FlgA [Porticoccaceae bacterium]